MTEGAGKASGGGGRGVACHAQPTVMVNCATLCPKWQSCFVFHAIKDMN
ncbi:hypothetical protein ACFLYX_03115 [Chloroflexota bacterium]